MERVEELLEELIGEIRGLRGDLSELDLASKLGSMDETLTDVSIHAEAISLEMSGILSAIERLGGVNGQSADLDDLLTAINAIQDKLPDASLVVHDLDDIHNVLLSIDGNTEK